MQTRTIRHSRRRRGRGPTGLTLAELMVGLSLMSLVGLTAATLASGLANAYRQTDGMDQSVQAARLAMMNVEALVRKSKLVLARNTTHLALWTADTNGDGQINLDEVALIRFDDREGVVYSEQVAFPSSTPASVAAALNETMDLADLSNANKVRKGLNHVSLANYLSRVTLAEDVSHFQVKTDEKPPYTKLVALQISVGPEAQQVALYNAVALRADAVDSVFKVDGATVLDLAAGDADGDPAGGGSEAASGNSGNGNGNGNGNGKGKGQGGKGR